MIFLCLGCVGIVRAAPKSARRSSARVQTTWFLNVATITVHISINN